MEIPDIGGLPAHPLLVHLPVVLIPLVAVFAIVLVIVPRWRHRFLPVLVIGSGLAFVGALLAASSGEELVDKVKRSATLDNHTELGDAAQWVAFVFFVVMLGWWAWERWGRERIPADHVAAKVARIGIPVIVVLWEEEAKKGGGDEDGLGPMVGTVTDAAQPPA
jgi:uncharacterized membrane protein